MRIVPCCTGLRIKFRYWCVSKYESVNFEMLLFGYIPVTVLESTVMILFRHFRTRPWPFKILITISLCHSNHPNTEKESILSGVKNHLFFPLVYRSSNTFFTVFFASSRCDTSLNVSFVITPFKFSSSNVYRVGIKWL